MKDKLIRAAEAHDEATAAFADIFGEGLANNWFRQTQLILKEQLNKAGLLASDAGEEAPEVDLEAEYKRMQDEAAAELDRLAPKAPKAVEVEQAVNVEGTEAQGTEAEGNLENIVENPLVVDNAQISAEAVATAVVEAPAVEAPVVVEAPAVVEAPIVEAPADEETPAVEKKTKAKPEAPTAAE